MKKEDEIQRQLDSDKSNRSSDAESYRLLFEILKEEPKSILGDDFEDSVIAKLPRATLFSWREFAAIGLIIILPIIGMFYWSELARQFWNLPTITWLRHHLFEIVFGILIIAGVQLLDRIIKKKLQYPREL